MAEQNWAGIYKALGYVHNTYGADTVTEPLKIRSLLLDLAPTAKKEINIFINILSEQDIIRRIRASTDVDASFVAQQIEDATGLSTESAVNTTKALMVALGKKEIPPVPSAPIKQKNQITSSKSQSVKSRRNGKDSLSSVGIILFLLGLVIVLVSFVFGIYGWFANTGLSRLLYYLIVTGGSVAGLLMTCFDELRSTKKDVVNSLWFVAVFGIAVPVVVTIIGLIGNLIIWIINLI